MISPLQKVAIFTRNLLCYDLNKIIIGRTNATIENLSESVITIDSLIPESPVGSGEYFDGEKEVFYYSDVSSVQIVMSFFGDNAYQNAKRFSLLIRSEASIQLQQQLNLAIFNVSQTTNTALLTGEQFSNRIDINFTIHHSETVSIETSRIDEAQFNFLQK